jgi:imidazoleglycerol-phosphate dehydratase
MERRASLQRRTGETDVSVKIDLDGSGRVEISTGIPFFDHMLTLFGAHGLFDLSVTAVGDLQVDYHHTVEDVGIVLGNAVSRALGDRRGIRRYGHAVTPMDETLAEVALDLSNRPYLSFRVPAPLSSPGPFDAGLAKEFFRALSTRGGMTLHVDVRYGENEHHVIESVFKAFGRALRQAAAPDPRVEGVPSTKGAL